MKFPSLRTAHLSLGLGLGTLFALTALTGSLLAFKGEIDAALNPSLWRVEPTSNPRPLGEVLAAATKEGGPPARMVLFPERADRAWLVFLSGRDPAERWEVLVDPATARVLGRRRFGTSWLEQVQRLHVELLAGKPGRFVVGLGGLGALALAATGLVLRWRRAGRPPFLAAHSWHAWVGLVAPFPLAVLILSGVMLSFRPYLTPVLNLATGPMPLENVAQSKGDPASRPPTPDDVLAAASKAFPDSRVTRLYLPEGPKGSFAARIRRPGEANPHGNTAVRYDRYDGSVIQWHSSVTTTPAQQALWYAPYPWHTGDALGTPGRLLVVLTGLAPAVLLATGLILWRPRFQSRSGGPP